MNSQRKTGFQLFEDSLYRWMGFAAGVFVVLKFRLVFSLSIHWDEFLFLSRVHEFLRGDQMSALQSFHVHCFQWLSVFPNEVDQIIIARGVMCILSLLSAGLIFKISRLYAGRVASLFSVICYLSYSNILRYGNDFRADSIAVFLFLAVLYCLLKNRLRRDMIIAGCVLALSFMITIKTSVYAAAVVCLFMIQAVVSSERKKIFKHAVIFFSSFMVSCFLLYGFHKITLGEGVPGFSNVDGSAGRLFAYCGSLFHKMFLAEGFFPRIKYFLVTYKNNCVIWIVLLSGAAAIFFDGIKKEEGWRHHAPLLALMILPLTVCVYRNAWPYYYVFIIPPAVIFCGITMEKLLTILQHSGGWMSKMCVCILVGMVIASGGVYYFSLRNNGIQEQREVVALVHAFFPDPVAYIDRCSMISSYPQAGFFMSTWGMESYKDRGEPVFQKRILSKQPHFLIANKKELDPERSVHSVDQKWELLEQDRTVLRQNYVRHWGPLFVAGKRFYFSRGESEQEFQIRIPGVYTLESEEGVFIDQKNILPEERVYLAEGKHRLEVKKVPAKIILRIGDNLYKPEVDWSGRPLFEGF